MYEKMHEHWKKYGPPVHITAAAFAGLKQKSRKVQDPTEIERKYVGPGGYIH